MTEGAERGAFAVLRDAYAGFSLRSGDMQAGYFAYACLLAIFPFLIFATAFAGAIIGEARADEAVAVLFDFAPAYLAEVLSPVLVELLRQEYNVFTVFIVLAIWAAMRAVEALARSFDAIYGERDRMVWAVRKLKALVTVVVSAAVAVVLGLLILLAPVITAELAHLTGITIPTGFTFARYAVGTVVLFAFLCALHWYLPSRQAAGYPIWPGAAFSTAAWIAMATGMSVYLAFSGSYTLTYGALAGIVITILFLYFTGAILIFGAELNRALIGAER